MIRHLFVLLLFLSIIPVNTAHSQSTRVKKSTEIIRVESLEYYIHKVEAGQTVKNLALVYGVSEESILAKNAFAKRGLREKQTLLIPTQRTYKLLENTNTDSPPPPPADIHNITAPTVKHQPQDTVKTHAQERHAEHNIDTVTTVSTGELSEFDRHGTIKVALILPFVKPTKKTTTQYSEFFNGVLLALNDLKNQGISTDVRVISYDSDTENNINVTDEAHRIIASGALDGTNLIIGPIYADIMEPFAQWATQNRVAIVSPLATVGEIESPYLFQATPYEATKYNKLRDLIRDNSANVVILKHSTHTDMDALAEFQDAIPEDYNTIEDVNIRGLSKITQMLSREKENILILPISDPAITVSILERINALNLRYKIRVVGPSNWGRISDANFETFFKLNVTFFANYHEDRMNSTINTFYSKYIESFENIPTMFSMRGYDVAVTFITGLSKWGVRMPMMISESEQTPLQVSYRYMQDSKNSSFTNHEWVMVSYMQDYTIVVK